MIETGKIFDLLIFVAGAGATLYFLWEATQTGRTRKLRTIAAVDAIEEMVDRSVETGLPIHVTPGSMGQLTGKLADQTIAGMNVTRHTVRLCFRKGAKVIVHAPGQFAMQDTLPLLDGIVREAAVLEGHPEAYNIDNIRFHGTGNDAFASGVCTAVLSEGVTAFIQIGPSGGDMLQVPGTVRQVGGVVIGGTARYMHNGNWAVLADYSIIQDEVFAAGAICSGDPAVINSIVSSDIMKMGFMTLLFLLAILGLTGSPILQWIAT